MMQCSLTVPEHRDALLAIVRAMIYHTSGEWVDNCLIWTLTSLWENSLLPPAARQSTATLSAKWKKLFTHIHVGAYALIIHMQCLCLLKQVSKIRLHSSSAANKWQSLVGHALLWLKDRLLACWWNLLNTVMPAIWCTVAHYANQCYVNQNMEESQTSF